MEDLGRKSVEEVKKATKFPVAVVLENIRSAYNIGSVFRTADAFLIEKIYLIGYSAQPPHKEIRKTALGAEESVNWTWCNTSREAIEELHSMGYAVFAVEQASGSISLGQLEWEEGKKIALVFGNEVSGVEQSTILGCDGCIEIPQMGMKHSLNIATAAGVVLWEIVRKMVPQ